jgi:hypothetical protein
MAHAVEFRKDTKGTYRAEVKIPVSAHQTMGALKQTQLMIHQYLEERPSHKYKVTHEENYCSFWVAINPKAPLEAFKLTNGLKRALQKVFGNVSCDYDELKALH